MTLRMSQASNKDMASGETGSMVQDDEDWVVGDEPTPPSSEPRENSRDNVISRLVEIAEQATGANGSVERSALELDVRNLLQDCQTSTVGLEMPVSWIEDDLQSKLKEELRDLHNAGHLAWATALVWATEQGMEQISIRHPTFQFKYEPGTRFAGGLPWRAVFRTKGDIIHILATPPPDNRLVERISGALNTARTFFDLNQPTRSERKQIGTGSHFSFSGSMATPSQTFRTRGGWRQPLPRSPALRNVWWERGI